MSNKLILPATLKERVTDLLKHHGYEGTRSTKFVPGEKQYSVTSTAGRLHLRINSDDPINAYSGILLELCHSLTVENMNYAQSEKDRSAAVTEMKAMYEDTLSQNASLTGDLEQANAEIATLNEKLLRIKNTVPGAFTWLTNQTQKWPGKQGNKFRGFIKEAKNKIPYDLELCFRQGAYIRNEHLAPSKYNYQWL